MSSELWKRTSGRIFNPGWCGTCLKDSSDFFTKIVANKHDEMVKQGHTCMILDGRIMWWCGNNVCGQTDETPNPKSDLCDFILGPKSDDDMF